MWLVHFLKRKCQKDHLMAYVKNLLYQFSDICSSCPTKIPVFNQPESNSFRCAHYVGLNWHIPCLQLFFCFVYYITFGGLALSLLLCESVCSPTHKDAKNVCCNMSAPLCSVFSTFCYE